MQNTISLSLVGDNMAKLTGDAFVKHVISCAGKSRQWVANNSSKSATSLAWCAYTVTAILCTAGWTEYKAGNFAGSGQLRAWAIEKQKNLTCVPWPESKNTTPKPGWIISWANSGVSFMSTTGGHVGFVVGFKGNQVRVVDGNSGASYVRDHWRNPTSRGRFYYVIGPWMDGVTSSAADDSSSSTSYEQIEFNYTDDVPKKGARIHYLSDVVDSEMDAKLQAMAQLLKLNREVETIEFTAMADPDLYAGAMIRIVQKSKRISGDYMIDEINFDGIGDGTKMAIKAHKKADWNSKFAKDTSGTIKGDRFSDSGGSSDTSGTSNTSTSTNKKGKIIGINPGHPGMSGTEASSPVTSAAIQKPKCTSGFEGEAKLNLEISKQVKKELEAKGYTVVMTRTTNQCSLSNKERAQYMNNKNCEVAVSIHCDDSVGGGKGAYIMAPTKSNPALSDSLVTKCRKLGDCIINGVKNAGCDTKRTSDRNDLTGINWTKIPAIYIECGNNQVRSDAANIRKKSYQEKLGKGIANGIHNYLNG